MNYEVTFATAALNDLQAIFDHITDQAGERVARNYVTKIYGFCLAFDLFPHRGTVLDDIRPGLRMIGYRRRVTVAFTVDGNTVIILRILYAGRQFDGG